MAAVCRAAGAFGEYLSGVDSALGGVLPRLTAENNRVHLFVLEYQPAAGRRHETFQSRPCKRLQRGSCISLMLKKDCRVAAKLKRPLLQTCFYTIAKNAVGPC